MIAQCQVQYTLHLWLSLTQYLAKCQYALEVLYPMFVNLWLFNFEQILVLLNVTQVLMYHIV